MNYDKKIDAIVNYIKSGEKSVDNFKVGFEVEHFIINFESMETVHYDGENGVRQSLMEIEEMGYEASYEGENIMGLSADEFAISIEPAAQFEVAFAAKKTMDELFDNYKEVMGKIVPVFDKKKSIISRSWLPTKIKNR